VNVVLWAVRSGVVTAYGLLFRLLTAVVPDAGELDRMVDILDGERE